MDHQHESVDLEFMREALGFAARIPRRPWPNPPVGAIVVRDGRVVGRGAHHGAGCEHAETAALREAGDRARGGTLYCTLEPCNHQGRTPPCAPAVVAAGVRRVVVAVRDPNPSVRGGGVRVLREAGLEVVTGVMAAEGLDLIWPFVATRAFERPFVILKTAASIDGCFAPPPGRRTSREPYYLTSLESRADAHRLRRWCDVVVVGERTVAADRPRLDARLATGLEDGPAAEPIPAYADTDLSLAAGWAKPHWVFAGAAAARDLAEPVVANGGRVVTCETMSGRVDPVSLVSRARELGCHVLLVEGGPTLAASFVRAGLIDRWIAYIAPQVLGSGVRWEDSPASAGFHATRATRLGPDVKLVFDRISFDQMLVAVVDHAGSA